MTTDVFLELFPIEPALRVPLAAYHVGLIDEAGTTLGGKLAYRLSKTFPGQWVYVQGHLLTDTPVAQIQMDITLDIIRQNAGDPLAQLMGVDELPDWQPPPLIQAEFVLRTAVRAQETALRAALNKGAVTLKNAVAEREPVVQAWSAAGEPALSLSIRSHLRYPHALSAYLTPAGDPASVIGLRVVDRHSATMVALVERYTGRLGQHRTRLLSLTKREVMADWLRQADDDEPVFLVTSGEYEYEYPASALDILIRPTPEELARFGVPFDQAQRSSRLRPDMRAALVQAASDVLKQAGIIGRAYSTRTRPEVFATVEFVPNLIYSSSRVLPYRVETLASDFLKGGVYQRHPRFADAPIRIAVINALDDSVEDFVEALRRQIERAFGFKIELIKERKVRVLAAENLKSAVRVIEKEDAQMLLAFFKDEDAYADEESESAGALLKSLTLGKGIASQVIAATTMHNPEAMPLIILGILGKTGNIPFALAEPLEYADYVVGLGLTRDLTRQGERITAISRLYRSDGVFVRYCIETLELEPDEPVPFILLETLLPYDLCAGKRIIIHHDGAISPAVERLLRRWQGVLQADLTLVEVLRQHVPRLYGLAGGKITQPPWGSLFRLNDAEAFLVSSTPAPNSTAQPLHVRVIPPGVIIEAAVYSVLAWTLLHYGAAHMPKLPVTLAHAEDMAGWLARGMLPAERVGDVPFWL